MADAVHVSHQSGELWVVATDDPDAPPISEHATRGEAETAARSHAMMMGIPQVVVHGQGGEDEVQELEPHRRPPSGGEGLGPLV